MKKKNSEWKYIINIPFLQENILRIKRNWQYPQNWWFPLILLVFRLVQFVEFYSVYASSHNCMMIQKFEIPLYQKISERQCKPKNVTFSDKLTKQTPNTPQSKQHKILPSHKNTKYYSYKFSHYPTVW